MCFNYYNNEYSIKRTWVEDLTNCLKPIEDRRLMEINKMIDNFTKERDRIIEIDKIGGSNE